jgi:hypothetical protein
MLYEPAVFGGAPAPRLAYRVTLDDGSQYLIDAHTGESLLEHGIRKDSIGLTEYELDLEDANGGTAEDTNCYNPTTIDDDIGDEDGLDTDFHSDDDAVAAWFAARRTYETFHDEFDRHSFDNDHAEIVAYVHVGFDDVNANAVPGCGIQFGNGTVSDDVMGHEFTHLVIDEESGLVYANESGALNESLSDVLGTAVDPADWLIAEETTVLGTLRSLADPPSLTAGGIPFPDRMSQFNNLGGADLGGVHFNSSITNKAFFLIAAGGSHNGRSVNGIGRTKMHLLAYRMTLELSANSTLVQARNRAVSIAEYWRGMSLNGFGNNEVCTVRNAFAAVELGFGDLDCDNLEDNIDDADNDGILDDGDQSGSQFDNRCQGGDGPFCDDNCPNTSNPTQKDFDNDGDGDACDDDDDNDGIPDVVDRCPNQPGTAPDTDGDGFYDCLDGDDDNDGVKDDGDSSGDPNDNPCPPFGGGPQPLCDDNCRLIPNPMQEDGDLNGKGDACNPDYDGDGIYGGIGEGDNCPWDFNPGQEDSDFDSLGDACDDCPLIFDFTGIWVGGIPELGIPPHPRQGDSDGDGTADPCDLNGTWSTYESNTYHNLNAVTAEEQTGTMEFISDSTGAGLQVRLPFHACTTVAPDGPAPDERVELRFTPFPGSLRGWVEDDWGRTVGHVRQAEDVPGRFGLLFKPRCDRSYTIVIESLANFDGYEAFNVFSWTYDNNNYNPYMPSPPIYSDVPTDVVDSDSDGLPDSIDSCPFTYDPTGADIDGDGVGNFCDNCPTAYNPLQGPAEFPTVYASPSNGDPTQDVFTWEAGGVFRYVIGGLHQLPFYGFQQTGSALSNSLTIQPGGDSRYYLFRFDGSCPGTYGSVDRDNQLP